MGSNLRVLCVSQKKPTVNELFSRTTILAGVGDRAPSGLQDAVLVLLFAPTGRSA